MLLTSRLAGFRAGSESRSSWNVRLLRPASAPLQLRLARRFGLESPGRLLGGRRGRRADHALVGDAQVDEREAERRRKRQKSRGQKLRMIETKKHRARHKEKRGRVREW